MNYINEINAFRDWVYRNSPSPGQISLWYALMDVANKTFWKEWFTSANSSLMLGSGLSRQGVVNARVYLRDQGLIDFRENGQNKAASYRIVSFFASKKLDIPIDIHMYNDESASKKLDIPVALDLPINKLDINKDTTVENFGEEPIPTLCKKIFGFSVPPAVTGYIMTCAEEGYQESFIRELLLEVAESAKGKPNPRYLITIGDEWKKNKIYSRFQAKQAKENKPKYSYTSPTEKEANLQQRRAEERRASAYIPLDLPPEFNALKEVAAAYDNNSKPTGTV